MKRSVWLTVALLVSLHTGCVTRRYVITSDPPGAVVYRDGKYIGATPVEEPFVYYGTYRFRLVKDGFQPLDVTPELVEPWYQWPGLDLISEVAIPYTFRDVQTLHFQLQPLEAVRHDDVRNRAEQLRQRGSQIQTPPGTEDPPKQPAPRTPPLVPVPAPVPGGPPIALPPPRPDVPAGPVKSSPALGAPRQVQQGFPTLNSSSSGGR